MGRVPWNDWRTNIRQRAHHAGRANKGVDLACEAAHMLVAVDQTGMVTKMVKRCVGHGKLFVYVLVYKQIACLLGLGFAAACHAFNAGKIDKKEFLSV